MEFQFHLLVQVLPCNDVAPVFALSNRNCFLRGWPPPRPFHDLPFDLENLIGLAPLLARLLSPGARDVVVVPCVLSLHYRDGGEYREVLADGIRDFIGLRAIERSAVVSDLVSTLVELRKTSIHFRVVCGVVRSRRFLVFFLLL